MREGTFSKRATRLEKKPMVFDSLTECNTVELWEEKGNFSSKGDEDEIPSKAGSAGNCIVCRGYDGRTSARTGDAQRNAGTEPRFREIGYRFTIGRVCLSQEPAESGPANQGRK
jgi:hypothetical protein